MQGYPGKLVLSSGTDITLDDVLTILDEHYNNVKALDGWMADKETVSDWGVCLSRHLQVLAASFPNCFLPQSIGRVKERLLLWQSPQVTESDGSLPEGGSTGKDSFRLPKGFLGS